MATEIASLYASLGADTSGLHKGLSEMDAMLDAAEKKMTDAETAIDNLGKSTEEAGGKAGGASKMMEGLVNKLAKMATVAGAIKLAKMINELGMLGAEAERVERTFENMTGGGWRSAEMLEGLRAATMGTKSEMELMEGASTLMALGLAQSADDLGNIMRNVEMLGGRFGGTMQIFQLMMSNQSMMRIDSFGIGVEEATKRIEEFKAAGMGAEEAFKTAVLELMNEKVEMLGGTLEDSVTQIERNKAAWQDLRNELGMAISGPVGDAHGAIGRVTRALADQIGVVNQLRREYGDADVSAAYQNMVYGYGTQGDTMGDLEQKMRRVQELTKLNTTATSRYADVQANLGKQTISLGDVTYDSAQRFDDYNRAITEAAEAADRADWLAAQERLEGIARAAAEAEEKISLISWSTKQTFGADMEAGQESLEGLRRKAEELESTLANVDLTPQEMSDLRGELSDIRGEIDNVAAGMEETSARFVLSLLEMQLAASGLDLSTQAEILAVYAEELGLIDEKARDMSITLGEILGDKATTAEEKLAALFELVRTGVGDLEEIGRAGTGSLLDIIAKADDAAEALRRIGLSAEAAQIMIDRMQGKTIDMSISWIERNRPTTPSGAYIEGRLDIGHYADGGTIPMGGYGFTGEDGMELLHVTPHGVEVTPMGGGGAPLGGIGFNGGTTWNGDVIINGAQDPAATADAVVRELGYRGIRVGSGLR